MGVPGTVRTSLSEESSQLRSAGPDRAGGSRRAHKHSSSLYLPQPFKTMLGYLYSESGLRALGFRVLVKT